MRRVAPDVEVPELIEVEQYRVAAEAVVGCAVEDVEVLDHHYVRDGLDAASFADAVRGSTIVAADRLGKVLLLETDRGHTVGLRFGMTGRLLVDGLSPIERLEYSPIGDLDRWVRIRIRLSGTRELTIIDPRRLGSVVLDPDLSRLGPDAASVPLRAFRGLLANSTVAVKPRLLDQSKLAGVGNLIADEALWHAGIDPARLAGSLDDAEVRRLHRGLRTTIRRLTRRGGSHTGDLQAYRQRGASCPRCGAMLIRRTIGGRTTYFCPREQH
jgi:formamidopyrimidine-DNA glycosylase